MFSHPCATIRLPGHVCTLGLCTPAPFSVRLPTPTEAAQQAAEAYAHSQARSHAHAQLPTMDAHAQLHAPHVQAAQAAAVTLQQMLQLRQAPSHLMNAHEAVMLAALQVSTPEYP